MRGRPTPIGKACYMWADLESCPLWADLGSYPLWAVLGSRAVAVRLAAWADAIGTLCSLHPTHYDASPEHKAAAHACPAIRRRRGPGHTGPVIFLAGAFVAGILA